MFIFFLQVVKHFGQVNLIDVLNISSRWHPPFSIESEFLGVVDHVCPKLGSLPGSMDNCTVGLRHSIWCHWRHSGHTHDW